MPSAALTSSPSRVSLTAADRTRSPFPNSPARHVPIYEGSWVDPERSSGTSPFAPAPGKSLAEIHAIHGGKRHVAGRWHSTFANVERETGTLRGNRTLTHVTLKQLRSEQIPTLALALRGNSTLAQLDIIHTSRMGGQSVVRLPVPKLNGSTSEPGQKRADDAAQLEQLKRVDLSETCLEGHIGRVACAMIGTLTAGQFGIFDIVMSAVGAKKFHFHDPKAAH